MDSKRVFNHASLAEAYKVAALDARPTRMELEPPVVDRTDTSQPHRGEWGVLSQRIANRNSYAGPGHMALVQAVSGAPAPATSTADPLPTGRGSRSRLVGQRQRPMKLEAVARAEGISVSDAVREAIAEHIARKRKDKAFRERLRAVVERDREILERLAR
jgi:hypothetical protein